MKEKLLYSVLISVLVVSSISVGFLLGFMEGDASRLARYQDEGAPYISIDIVGPNEEGFIPLPGYSIRLSGENSPLFLGYVTDFGGLIPPEAEEIFSTELKMFFSDFLYSLEESQRSVALSQ